MLLYHRLRSIMVVKCDMDNAVLQLGGETASSSIASQTQEALRKVTGRNWEVSVDIAASGAESLEGAEERKRKKREYEILSSPIAGAMEKYFKDAEIKVHFS